MASGENPAARAAWWVMFGCVLLGGERLCRKALCSAKKRGLGRIDSGMRLRLDETFFFFFFSVWVQGYRFVDKKRSLDSRL